MKFKFLIILSASVSLLMGAAAFAGPKNEKVSIEHTPPSDNSSENSSITEGSVELSLSISAALNHLDNHAGDCLVDEDVADDLGLIPCLGDVLPQ
jgi:hypothetical protein